MAAIFVAMVKRHLAAENEVCVTPVPMAPWKYWASTINNVKNILRIPIQDKYWATNNERSEKHC